MLCAVVVCDILSALPVIYFNPSSAWRWRAILPKDQEPQGSRRGWQLGGGGYFCCQFGAAYLCNLQHFKHACALQHTRICRQAAGQSLLI